MSQLHIVFLKLLWWRGVWWRGVWWRGVNMLDIYNQYDDFDYNDDDYCYECTAYGDDCYMDEYGNWIHACDGCLHNRFYDYDEEWWY